MPGSSTRRSGPPRRRDRTPGALSPARGSGEGTRFVVDAMLGSLARKLRALGFDAAYYKAGGDSGLLELSRREGRILLTSDRSLAARAKSRQFTVFLVTGDSDGKRIGSIARSAALSGARLARGEPLCSLCGGALRVAARGKLAKVPPLVLRRHRLFFECASCGQVYWRGSHWKRLMSLARRLNQKKLADLP